MLAVDAALYRQVGTEGADDLTIELADPYGCVSHVVETVARRIVGPELASALGVGPIDRDYAKKLHELIEELTWAIDAAAALDEDRFPSDDDGRDEVA